MVHFRVSPNNSWDKSLRREFIKVACQVGYVQVPSGHQYSFSMRRITCHDCLKWIIELKIKEASYCKQIIKISDYEKPTGFKFKDDLRNRFVKEQKIDPEILARI